jgi:CubicO group peptidase (beta-lactamase class C family)
MQSISQNQDYRMNRYRTIKFIFKYIVISIIVLGILFLLKKFTPDKDFFRKQSGVPFLSENSPLIDTMLRKLSSDEKLAQMIIFESDTISSKNYDSILNIVNFNKPGGIILKTDSVSTFLRFRKNSAQIGKIEPFYVLKPENCFPDFLKDFIKFPSKSALDAISNDSVQRLSIKKQIEICNLTGFNFLILPFENNDKTDSFAEVFYKETANRISKIQQNNIITTIYQQKFCSGDSVSNLLFQKYLKSEISGIFPRTEPKAKKGKNPISKKSKILGKYGGLVLHDISGIGKNYQDSVLFWLKNGNEIFITDKPAEILNALKYLIQSKKISQKEIDFKVRKILQAKYWTNSFKPQKIESDSIRKFCTDLNNQAVSRILYKNSICILADKKNKIPVGDLKNQKIVVYTFGSNHLVQFCKVLNEYYPVSEKHFGFGKKENISSANFSGYTKYIIASDTLLKDSALLAKIKTLEKKSDVIYVNFGSPENIKILDSISSAIEVFDNSEITQKYAADAVFGGISVSGRLPFSISKKIYSGKIFKTPKTRLCHVLPEEVGSDSKILTKIDSIVGDAIRRGATPGCQVFAAKDGMIIFDKAYGTQTYDGGQRVTADDLYDIASVTKVAATTLEAMKLYESGLLGLDDNIGKFFKDTKIEYKHIKADTIINLDTMKYADVKDFKKILQNQDTVRINDSLFLAYDTIIATSSPKNNIFKVTVRQLLLHQSGISPALPILPYILYKKDYYSALKRQAAYLKAGHHSEMTIEDLIGLTADVTNKFNIYYSDKFVKDSAERQIAENFYFKKKWCDTLWSDTKQLKVFSRKIYQYSDVNMILLQTAMDSLLHKGISNFLTENFYSSLGLQTIGYKPLTRFNKNRIVPTEDEKYWRNQLLRGYVHDPSAAILGGISGNAGLFSNAHDLGVICQMWLNGGTYGGVQYLKESTVKKFTARQPDSGRGLGFDKPGKKQIIADGASSDAFGHTGFTGACVWVDPESGLVFVFLSNRVHPKQTNWKLNGLRVRQKIHTVIYQSLKKN